MMLLHSLVHMLLSDLLAEAHWMLSASPMSCLGLQAGRRARFLTHVAFWDNLVWSTQLLLWTRTHSPVYRARVRAFLDDWRLARTVRAQPASVCPLNNLGGHTPVSPKCR